MIVIVDYGLGNLGAIQNMFRRLGIPAAVSSSHAEIAAAAKLVLPGVGAFDHGARQLTSLGLRDILSERVLKEAIPVLGICLGAQLMTRRSEEGSEPGLGWVQADTIRFDAQRLGGSLPVPHMGWSDVTIAKESALLRQMPAELRFYFVHSFHFLCDDADDVIATTQYGYTFASAFQRRNVYGVQFHPEKSHKFGMRLMRNFAEIE